MENAVIEYPEKQELKKIRIENHREMAIVKYDYQEELIDRQSNQLQPNREQVSSFDSISFAAYIFSS